MSDASTQLRVKYFNNTAQDYENVRIGTAVFTRGGKTSIVVEDPHIFAAVNYITREFHFRYKNEEIDIKLNAGADGSRTLQMIIHGRPNQTPYGGLGQKIISYDISPQDPQNDDFLVGDGVRSSIISHGKIGEYIVAGAAMVGPRLYIDKAKSIIKCDNYRFEACDEKCIINVPGMEAFTIDLSGFVSLPTPVEPKEGTHDHDHCGSEVARQ